MHKSSWRNVYFKGVEHNHILSEQIGHFNGFMNECEIWANVLQVKKRECNWRLPLTPSQSASN